MKKILLALVLLVLLILLYVVSTIPRTKPVYLSPTDQIYIKENIKVEKEQKHKVYSIIERINKKNELIDRIKVSDMPIKLKYGKLTAKVLGEMALEKDKKFRLLINHRFTGKEMDIGSNDNYFWFWSKRMKPPYLHYAKHEDLNKTLLRTALNPNWMIESLNINKIETENTTIEEFKEYWALSQIRISSNNEQVKVVTLINPKTENVIGRYLYSKENKMLASTEYQDFINNIATKILIIWYEEGITLDWDLSNVKINCEINSNFWEMPDIKDKINMGN